MLDDGSDQAHRFLTHTAAAAHPGGWGFELPERWRLEGFLGAGGQAEVWRAYDREVDEIVAVKVFAPALTPERLGRLRREVRLEHSLQHPCLVRVHELIDAGGRPALVMEWMPGDSLAHQLSGAGPFRVNEVVTVAERALLALAYLHGKSVLHRDVKPSNLLLDRDGHVRLADLGLAKSLEAEESLTATAMAVGSPAYMSPEQLRGDALTPASDLYSLGATLFHLLTGKLPFRAETSFEVARAHQEAPIPDPRKLRHDCPRWLARFVMRLLDKRPDDRFPDAGVALAAFRRRRWAASRRVWRNRLVAAAGLAAMLGASVALLWLGSSAGRRVVTVQAEGGAVRGVAASGQPVWEYDCGAAVRQVERADFDGDGEQETVVAVVPTSGIGERTRDQHPSEVLILDATGHLRDRICPDEILDRYVAQPLAPALLVPRLSLTDLDGDGHPDVVINCQHRSLGIAALFGYWGRTRQAQILLYHPGGWIYHLALVPQSRPARLRFLAFNSLIGSHVVAGELIVGEPAAGSIIGGNWLVAAFGGASLAWYTPLDQKVAMLPADDQPGFAVGAQGASTFSLRGVRYTIDRFGNPVPGPNADHDRRLARLEFIQTIGELDQGSRNYVGVPQILQERARLAVKFAPLMREAAYRSILDLELSRVLARAGGVKESVDLLRNDWSELRYDGLGLWLAHAQALAGDLDGAVTTAETTMANANSPSGFFRAPQLLLRLAIERRDPALFRRTLPLSMRGQEASVIAAVEGRAHLWWDRLDDGDCRVRSFDLVPDGEAVACLARWRLGRSRPEDAALMQGALRRNPDAEAELLVARAMALVASGKAPEAVSELERAEAALSLRGRNNWDFLWEQVDQLAHACRAKALLAAGRRDEALRLAHRLAPVLRPGLLPAILVNEVVQEIAKDARESPRQERE